MKQGVRILEAGVSPAGSLGGESTCGIFPSPKPFGCPPIGGQGLTKSHCQIPPKGSQPGKISLLSFPGDGAAPQSCTLPGCGTTAKANSRDSGILPHSVVAGWFLLRVYRCHLAGRRRLGILRRLSNRSSSVSTGFSYFGGWLPFSMTEQHLVHQQWLHLSILRGGEQLFFWREQDEAVQQRRRRQ